MFYKLNSTQQTFYTEMLTGDIPVWNYAFYAMFDVEIEFDEFSRILNEIIFENAMFRSSFFKDENNQIKQHINDYVPQEFECLIFNTKKELEDYAKNIVDCPTLICNNPLKLYVFKLGNKCGCLVRIHHILCDGMCMRIMVNKLRAKLNLSESLESEKELYPYEKIFTDEEKFINSSRYNKSIRFWNEKLQQGFETSIYGFTSSDDYSTSERWFDFDNKKITAVKQICVDNNIPFSAFVYFVYAVCVNKNIGLSKFSVGMPILNRFNNADMNTLGLFMHILPLVINIDENSSLLSALSNIYADILELAKYQRFTQYDIKKNCNCNHIQQLFDVVVNYFPEEFLTNCEYDMFNSRFATAPLELCVREKNDGSVQLQVIYRNSLFKLKNIEEIVEQFNAIIDAFVENPNAIIKDIDITSNHIIDNSERKLILNQFNETKHKYKNQSIKELFEEKAKENADKNAVLAVDKALTYQKLNEEANKIANSLIEKGIEKGDIVAFILPRRSYLVSTMLGILKSGAVYLPIDPDYPQDRIEYMLNNSGAKLCITEENVFELLKNSNVQNPNINIFPDDACYCIYTSGSLGMPKGTLIKHSNVANCISNSYPNQIATVFKENNCESIVSTATASFDMFVCESILPLCNDMTVILADEEQSKNQSKLNEITADAIQTTPTKMKMLMSNKSQLDYLKKLKVIILGGEAVDSDTVNNLKALTNARIYNYYGPTETTVWSTSTEITDINDITIGKPIANTRIYIVDDNMQITPIGVVGELCIAGDGVCLGYLNNPELTAEKFIDNPFGEGKLYKTGDLAYWREDGNIVYVGRNDFQVKIRGLRIELGEIENAINSVDGIERSVVVVKKDNEDRQIVCAYYTGAEKTSSEIKKQISSKLPQYMLPHIFKHIEKMPTTSNGKLDRKALPEVDLNNIESAVEYVEAKSEEEKILVQAIKKVLNIDRVSLLDNFLDIGGDSLKSIELIAELEENGYTLNPREIFATLNIKELALKLEKKTIVEKTIEYGSVLSATDAQMRVYSAQLMDEGSTLYNIPYVFRVKELNVDKLQFAVNKLIERYEILRTHFENRNGKIYQVIDDNAEALVQKLLSDDITEFNKPFNLTKSPLFRIGYYKNTVMVDMHHIIADGKSLSNFFKELNELYMGRTLKTQAKQYGEFSVTAAYTEDNKEYWLKEYAESIPTLDLNTDYPRGSKRSFEGKALYSFIDTEAHKRITEKCINLGITNYVYYISAFSILMSKYSANDDVVIGTPSNGRTSRFVDSMGMFVNTLALRTQPKANKTINDFLLEIKNKSINAIENQNYPYGELVKELGISTRERNPIFDVMFAYQAEQLTEIIFADEKCELLAVEQKTSKEDLTFYVLPRENDVVLMAEYRTKLFKQSTIERYTDSFKLILEQMLDETKQIKDISANCEEDLILNKFNETKHKYVYAEGQTIYSMFEKTANENAERICLKADGKEITFGELLNISEAVDCTIRSNVNDKSIVAVIADRSVEMYSAIYGIIRGGNAYLPIDPNYPQERIDYILDNSCADLVLAQGKYADLVNNRSCIDMTSFIENMPQYDFVPSCNAEEDDTAYVIYTSGSTGLPKGARISHKSAVNRIAWMHDFYPLEKDDVILQKTPYTFDVSVWEIFWWGMFGEKLVASKPNEHFVPEKILNEVANNKVTHLHFVPSVFDVFLSYLEKNSDKIYKFSSVKHVFLSGEALTENLIKRFYKLYDYKNVKLHNLYGPTECAVDVTYYDCNPNDVNPVPIGKPIYNTQMYVLDVNLKPLPIGVIGELHIGGVNVGQGYLNNEILTAERFIDNPFGEGKLYKTGDLAYWREDGNIVYVGRNDFQVKIRGLRIELGEIENAINSVDGIEQSVIVVKKDNDDRKIICAYYTGVEIASSEIKKQISSKLPQYMLPHIFKHIEEMPTTSNGKLDRNALPQVDLNNIESAVEYVEAKSEEEKILVQAIKKVLNIDRVSLLDNFLDIGGDSLKSIELVAKLEAADYTTNQRAIFDSATIKELATKIDKTNYQDVTVEYDKAMPATGLEMIVYTAQIVDGNSTLYNVPYVFNVDNLDIEKLMYAVNKMIERHESLRTHFENRDGIIYQVIDEPKSINAVRMESNDLSLFVKPFDLTKSPLLRVGYYENTVMIDFHHIIADGESMPIFFNELNELYMGRELTVAPKQYGEFAATTGYTEENINYWKNVYSETISSINLNTDFPRPAIQSFQGNAVYDYIPVDLHNRITDKCRKIGVTNYAYYMSAINLLFSKYSGNNDIVIGTPSNARTSRYINSIGMFVNTLAIRTKIDEDNTVLELLNEVKNESIDAIENQNFPFGNLVKLLGIDTKEQNLYNVMFTYQSEGVSNIVFADKVREIKEVPVTTAKTDLLFYVLPSRSKVSLMVEYCTKLYKKSTVERFIKSFKHVLEQMLDETKQIKDIFVNCEYDLVVNQFNNTAIDYPKEKCIYQFFAEQAERNPNKVAVISCDRTLTYSKLQKEVEENSKKLQILGVEKGNVVAVHIERNSSLIVLQLAVLKAGAIFLPVDKRYPVDRINYMCNDCNVKLFITDEDINTQAETTVKLEELIKLRVENAVKDETNNSSCYIIYTSGSTGEPKGCLLNNRGLVNFCVNNNTLKTLKENENNVFACVNSASFDYFIAETLFPLLNGYTTVLFTEEESVNQTKFLEKVKAYGINVLMTTPTRLNLFFGNNNNCDALKQLTCICSSGEPLTSELLGTMYSKAPNAKIYNPLGPSECTVWDLGGELDKNAGLDVHLGKPIANSQVYILDKNLNPTPIGATGEICIAGHGVGDGYVNRPELTAEKFIDNPFGEGKLYKTGDLAYWREDGNIVYVGRNDFQVKIRGLRIELGEIENAICSVNGVEQSAVVVKEDNNRQILCAFYTGIGVEAYEIKKQISSVLPKYMLPNFYICVDAMPLTSSGKIDRKKLSQFEIKNVEVKSNKDVEPKTELEKYICSLFDEILGVENSNLESDFYDLGGNSLDLIRLLSYEKFEAIKVSDFMLNPTPKGLSEIVKGENVTLYNYIETLYMPDNTQKAIVLFPFGGGNSSGYSALVNEFKKNNSNIALYYVDWLNNAEDYNAASKEIISLSSNVDVSFYSHCAGSVIALKLLDILPPNVIKCYIAGATVPPKKPNRINLWSMLSNKAIIKYLEKAGFKRDMLDDFVLDKMISQFRVNTKEYQMYFINKVEITNANVISVISKYDPFTKNHNNLNEIWKRYASDYKKSIVINSKSHYFQRDNASQLYEIITNIAKEG